MKKYIYTIFAAALLFFTGCDDILDRPQLNSPTDETFWTSEISARLFANSFYTNYFVGYGTSWTGNYGNLRGFTFDDNQATTGKQANFENAVPSSRSSTSEAAASPYLTEYVGPNWNFAWVRKANIFLNRLETKMKGNVSDEVYNHWHAVASFFKCFAYARLVAVFGDVPYFESEFSTADLDIMYKDRDSRVTVMDAVHDMLKNDVLVNMRTDDKDNYKNTLNRYVAAAFASRWMLFEGTWQKYHGGDQAAATKYLTLAKEAAEIVMNSGNYAIDLPFHELFGSQDLDSKESLITRIYDAAQSVRHCVASYSNGQQSQNGANLSLIKSFICQDGKVYQNSSLENADVLSIANLIKTRDPRFEATFINKANTYSSTLLFAAKFIDRYALTLDDPNGVEIYKSNTNTNDAPVIRYAEVLLNWIEAKAELGAITQEDIDRSINVLRDRPLDDTAIERGVQKTAPMRLSDITADFDPDRDPTVDPIIWEIRRERRMELVAEHCRLHDIKRWKKLDYMDNLKYPDTMLGPWINMKEEVPAYLGSDYIGKRQVMKEDGTIVTYNGTNEADMVGYYIPTGAIARDPFSDRSYLSPIGLQDIEYYNDNGGYTLTQTKGW